MSHSLTVESYEPRAKHKQKKHKYWLRLTTCKHGGIFVEGYDINLSKMPTHPSNGVPTGDIPQKHRPVSSTRRKFAVIMRAGKCRLTFKKPSAFEEYLHCNRQDFVAMSSIGFYFSSESGIPKTNSAILAARQDVLRSSLCIRRDIYSALVSRKCVVKCSRQRLRTSGGSHVIVEVKLLSDNSHDHSSCKPLTQCGISLHVVCQQAAIGHTSITFFYYTPNDMHRAWFTITSPIPWSSIQGP